MLDQTLSAVTKKPKQFRNELRHSTKNHSKGEVSVRQKWPAMPLRVYLGFTKLDATKDVGTNIANCPAQEQNPDQRQERMKGKKFNPPYRPLPSSSADTVTTRVVLFSQTTRHRFDYF